MFTHNRNETISRVVVFFTDMSCKQCLPLCHLTYQVDKGRTETINIFTNTIYFYKNLSMCLGLAILHEHLCYSAGKFY